MSTPTTKERFEAKVAAAHSEALIEDTARLREQMEWERQPRGSGWHHPHNGIQAHNWHYESCPPVGNGFEETKSAFHISGGLFAQRLNCDCIALRSLLPRRILPTDPMKQLTDPTGSLVWDSHVIAIFSPNVWASIVCSVSAGGETSERWQHILEFHGSSASLPASETQKP